LFGIVGILGHEPVAGQLVDALKRLEYRGYDSAGVATLEHGALTRRRAEGKLRNLEARLQSEPLQGLIGIGHTRWATHGPPSDANAHPHSDEKGRVAVVHNGIIENYLELRRELGNAGVRFTSDTDTEVLAHLVGREMDRGTDLAEALRRSLARVTGYYAVAVISIHDGEPRLACARAGPPLMVAVTPHSAWLASDVLALIPHDYARRHLVLSCGMRDGVAPPRPASDHRGRRRDATNAGIPQTDFCDDEPQASRLTSAPLAAANCVRHPTPPPHDPTE
jgi:glucosamine--fructose-6-phosphate aminotransferase (isomerizing)